MTTIELISTKTMKCGVREREGKEKIKCTKWRVERKVAFMKKR
ncbi:unnamed protein product [Wuchereria bancrofti]|uniref:Uncharacterized protein n=1 Tax=Wuchereria bancrofti TaxID=6293 RepID=A0A3P7DY76_WUCBA|nr:unnamed protein product [Wuchereria bancrofti]